MTKTQQPIAAVLIRGSTYTLRGGPGEPTKTFRHGEPVEVTPAERDHLAAATETIREYEPGGAIRHREVPKFSFEPADA